MFSLGAAANITDGSDVLLLEARLVVQDSDAVSLDHKGEGWNHATLTGIAVVVGILAKDCRKVKRKSRGFRLVCWKSI